MQNQKRYLAKCRVCNMVSGTGKDNMMFKYPFMSNFGNVFLTFQLGIYVGLQN